MPPYQPLITLKAPWPQSSLFNKQETHSKLILENLLQKELFSQDILSTWSEIFINHCTLLLFITTLTPKEMLEEISLNSPFLTKLFKTSILSGMLVLSDYKTIHILLLDLWISKTSHKWKDSHLLSLILMENQSKNLPKTLTQLNGQKNHSWLLKTQLIHSWWKPTLPLNNTSIWSIKPQKEESLLLVIVWLTLSLMFTIHQHQLTIQSKASKNSKKCLWIMQKPIKVNFKKSLDSKTTSIFNHNDGSF